MTEAALFPYLLYGSLVVALGTAVYLLFSAAAPYGRHARAGWGPTVNNTFGWVLMEAPASLAPLALFALSERRDAVTWTFLLIWQLHYAHRAFVYPLSLRGRGTRVPLAIAASGALFNLLNAYLNWRWLTHIGPAYPSSWLSDPRFLGGLFLFLAGYFINRQADHILLHLRKPGETGYKIPRGGLYGLISCPNYFGELVEWSGWALLTYCVPGLFFAVFTAANLIPRALSHHRDYHRRFPDYPTERRAVLPFVL
jgi:3-oxo-5-alpha-steroid 4-dehydrogenase 1